MEPEVFDEKPLDELESGKADDPQDNRPDRPCEGPDGRSAWCVAVAACCINFIMAGLTRMSGILFVAFIDSFGVERREAAMPFSVRSSTGNLLGPLIGILGQKYGARCVILCGGVVAATSAAACFFAHDVTWLTFWWGGVNGLGVSLIVIMPQVVIGQYFDKYRTTASGMAFSGGCVGSFIFPVLLENLIAMYGVEGTFLIISGIMMHVIPAAMILKRPPWLRPLKNTQKPEDVELARTPEKKPLNGSPKKSLASVSDWVWDSPDKTDSAKMFLNDGPSVHFLRLNSGLVIELLTKVDTGDAEIDKYKVVADGSLSEIEFHIWAEMEDLFRYIQFANDKSYYYHNLKQNIVGELLQKESRKSISKLKNQPFPVNSLSVPQMGLQRSRSVPDLVNEPDQFPKNFVLCKLKNLHALRLQEVLCLVPGKRRVLSKLARELRKLYNVSARIFRSETKRTKKMIKIATKLVSKSNSSKPDSDKSDSVITLLKTAVFLHKDLRFMLICACKIIHFVCYIPILTTVVDFVQDKGLGKSDGKYAIAALSLGDLIGRLCLGWITDRRYLTMPRYMMLGMILQGASAAALPLMHTRETMFPVLAVTGLLQGSLFVRHPVLISTYMEPKVQSIAMGCVTFMSGILGLGIPTYIGYFRDTLGCYDHVFLINGCLGIFVGLLWLFEPWLCRSAIDSLKPDKK